MGPTWIKKTKEKSKSKGSKACRSGERALVQRVLYFFKFLVLKFSFSDSRVSDHRISSE